MKRLVLAISVFLLFAAGLVSVFQGSALATEPMPDYTVKGRAVKGLVNFDVDGRIVTQSREVVFDVSSFPLKYDDYNSINVQDYEASVKVSTVYENVTGKDVVVRAGISVGTRNDEFSLFNDRYRITVDGVEIERADRYAYRGRYAWSEDAEETVSLLRDERRTDGIFDADTVVKEYVYKVCCDTEGEFDLFVKADLSEGLAFFAEGEKYLESDDFIIYRTRARDGDEIKCYAVGGDMNILFQTEKDGTGAACEAVLAKRTDKSLAEVADGSCVIGDSERVRTDWFNLLISYLEDGLSDKDTDPFTDTESFAEKYTVLIKEYSFEIKAGNNVTCTLTAPLFPNIDEQYDPYMYRYEFSAGRNEKYADGYLTRYVINTPYFLTGLPSVEKTEDGYVIEDKYSSVCFSLCSDENPKYVGKINTYGNFYADTFIAVHVFWCTEALATICFAAVNIAAGAKNGFSNDKLLKRVIRAVGICIGSLAATAFFAFASLYCAYGSGNASASEITTVVVCTLMSAAVTVVNCGLLKIKNKKGKDGLRIKEEEVK